MPHHALQQLRAIAYFPEHPSDLDAALSDWLLLEDSMTKRFEQHCHTVSVEILFEGFVGLEAATPEEAELLPADGRFWLREILLCGDGVPWLAGRTLVPESTLNGPELKLRNMGTTPLGRYLFTSSTLTRDFIQTGKNGECWGRRSRLRLSGKPLLLTELFLPPAPVYW